MNETLVPGEWRRPGWGGAVALLGVVLLGVPVYDVLDEVPFLGWRVLPAVVENATFLLLAAGIAAGGVWLVRSDWATRHVRVVAKRTIGGWMATTALFGWVVVVQLYAMGALKPRVIAMNGVLVGTAVTFGGPDERQDRHQADRTPVGTAGRSVAGLAPPRHHRAPERRDGRGRVRDCARRRRVDARSRRRADRRRGSEDAAVVLSLPRADG